MFVKGRFALAAWLAACFAWPCLGQTAPYARVLSLTGAAWVRRANQQQPLQVSAAAQAGDEIVTGENSEAVLETSEGATVRIFPDSRVVLTPPARTLGEFLDLVLGSVKVHVERLSGRPNPHKMTTPTAVIAVRGTTFSVFVDDEDATLVAVDEGRVGVAGRATPFQEVLLGPGQRTRVRRGQPPVPAQLFRGRSEHADLLPGPERGQGRAAMRSRGRSETAKADRDSGPQGKAVGHSQGTRSGHGRADTISAVRPASTPAGQNRRPGPPH